MIMQSCEKEEKKAPVYAGIVKDDLLYVELNPPLQVTTYYDTANFFHYGVDSLDMNKDGIFDIVISVGYMEGDSAITPTLAIYPHTSLNVRDSIQFATEIEYYPMGLGTFGKIYWIDTLSYNNRIDDFKTWQADYSHQFMWVVPPAFLWGSNGTWYNLGNTEKYVGVRMKIGNKYKYGWIKVKVITRNEMQFISYAIQK